MTDTPETPDAIAGGLHHGFEGEVSSGNSEPRYTLAEAERELARRGCRLNGHEYEMLTNGFGDLIRVTCGQCGKSWDVTER